MSNDFSNDDGVDEGICLESNSAAERISKAGNEKVCFKKNVVLHLIRLEFIFFIAAHRVLCFGFVTEAVLIEHQGANSC